MHLGNFTTILIISLLPPVFNSL